MASKVLTAWWGKNKKKIIIAAVVVVVLWGFLVSRDRPETELMTIPEEYASADREVYVHAPSDPADPLPLVLILHDDGSEALDIERFSDASKLADRRDFAVAYPEAVNSKWRVTDPRGADAQYLRDVVQFMQKESKIDIDRVYVWGFGSGGLIALEAACAGTDRVFAAVGYVAIDPEPAVTCPPEVRKIPIAQTSWTEDTTDDLWDMSSNLPQQS